MVFTKGAHHSAKFETFDCSGEISPNLYLDRLLLLKVSAKKKYGGVMSHDTKECCKIWRETYHFFKNDKNFVIFDLGTIKSLENLHFDWSLLCKVYNVWHKKVQRSIFHDTEESRKIWRKTELRFGKWHEGFNKFLNYIMFEVKKYRGVMLDYAQDWCKACRKTGLCFFKIDMRNLANFHQSTWKSPNWDLHGILLSEVENVWP